MTANTFGVHQSTMSKVVIQVCSAILRNIGSDYLHLPRTEEEMRTKIAQFETKFGIVQAFGCIDGTHIPNQKALF